MTDRPTGTADAMAGADLSATQQAEEAWRNRTRRQSAEARCKALEEQRVHDARVYESAIRQLQRDVSALDDLLAAYRASAGDAAAAELRSLREQNAKLRDELARLQRLPSCALSGCVRCTEIDAMMREGGAE